jgi:hypothetical protein
MQKEKKEEEKPLIRQLPLISVSIETGYSDALRYFCLWNFCMSWNLNMCTDKKPDATWIRAAWSQAMKPA